MHVRTCCFEAVLLPTSTFTRGGTGVLLLLLLLLLLLYYYYSGKLNIRNQPLKH
jgi:hypothetical protein